MRKRMLRKLLAGILAISIVMGSGEHLALASEIQGQISDENIADGVEEDPQDNFAEESMQNILPEESEEESQAEQLPSEEVDEEEVLQEDSEEDLEAASSVSEEEIAAWEEKQMSQGFLDLGPDHLDAQNGVSAASEGIENAGTGSASFSKINNLLVLVRFQDQTDDYMNAQNSARLDATYNSTSMQGSMKDFVEAMSYGELTVDTAIFPRSESTMYCSVQVEHTIDYYLTYSETPVITDNTERGYMTSEERFKRERALCDEILRKVKAEIESELTEAQLDENGDGYIDSISFAFDTIAADAKGRIQYADLLWPHKTSYASPVTVHGLYMSSYNFLSRGTDNVGMMGTKQCSGIIVHEFLHTLGLPDLYRYSKEGTPVGKWDVMATTSVQRPQNLNAWYQREYMGWGEKLEEITQSQHVILYPACYEDSNEKYAVKIADPEHPNQFFVAEFRKTEGNDASLSSSCTSGLLVYRIVDDFSAGISASQGNAGGNGDAMYVFRPGETGCNAGKGRIDDAALSYQKNDWNSIGKAKGEETEGFDPKALTYSDGTNSGICIKNVTLGSADSISFDVEFSDEEKVPELKVITNATQSEITGIIKNLSLNDISQVKVAVWSENNGQDDLIWYKAQLQTNGDWMMKANISEHQNDTGIYYLHVYITEGGKEKFISGKTVVISGISAKSSPFVEINKGEGTFCLQAGEIASPAPIVGVKAAVWSLKNGQDDLKWYVCEEKSDGTWYVNVDCAAHDYEEGTYIIHIYAEDSRKVSGYVSGIRENVEFQLKAPLIEMDLNKEESNVVLALKYATGLNDGGIVRFAVWSKQGGQDDLRWYAARRTEGIFYSSFSISDHLNSTGVYYIHVYYNNNNESRFIAGSSIYISGITAEQTPAISGDAISGMIAMKVGGIYSPAGIRAVKAAVWSSNSGQDDLRWYALSQNGDTWEADAYLADHSYEWGEYNVHFYVWDKRGVEQCISACRLNIGISQLQMESVLNESQSEAEIYLELQKLPEGAKSVQLAVWSKENGQDDLRWYTSVWKDGSFTGEVQISDHKNNTGIYYVHAYLIMKNGQSRFLAGNTFSVQDISCDSVQAVNANSDRGTFEVQIKNLFSPAGIRKVRIAVWTKQNGQDDIFWYFAKLDEYGIWNTEVDTYMHDYESGIYYVHAYAEDERGIESYVGGFALSFRQNTSDVLLQIENVLSENRFDIALKNAKIGRNVTGIQFAVWSRIDGQDDLIWYEASKTDDGSWKANVNTKNHKDDSGIYYIHAYATLKSGGKVCLKTTNAMILNNWSPQVDTKTVEIEGISKEYNFLFVSDTHVIVPSCEDELKVQELAASRIDYFKNAYGMTAEEQFPYWIRYANDIQLDGFFMGGDIVDYPSGENLNYLKMNLDNLQVPFLYTLGNHDWTYPWEYLTETASALYRPLFQNFMKGNSEAQFIEYDDFIVLAVDDSTNQVNEAALPVVEQVINYGKPVILMMHVPLQTDSLLETSIKVWGSALMIGKDGIVPNEVTQKFLDIILADDSPVCAILAGHVHLEDTGMVNDKIVQYVVEMSSKGRGIMLRIKGK